MLKIQADLVESKITKQNVEKRMRQMGMEITELLERLKAQQSIKSEAQKELEMVKRERNYLGQSLQELKRMFE